MPGMSTPSFVVRPVYWKASREKLAAVRRTVFIEEQSVPEDLEWDDEDERSYHVLATLEDGTPVGTGRLKLDCHIGRMAVLPEWRRRGVGSAILQSLIEYAQRDGCTTLRLNAQTHALGFYERYGFCAVGDEFGEAGIPHRAMELRLEVSS
jgi:predicted GNAT family N-acyltransferase